MEENNNNSFLKSGTGLAITLAFISIAILLANKGMSMMGGASSKIDTFTVQMENSTFNAYDNKSVSGSEAIAAINTKASKSVTVKVKTNGNGVGTSYNSPTYNVTNINDKDYIEPTAIFDAKVEKTSNGTINAIIFTQS